MASRITIESDGYLKIDITCHYCGEGIDTARVRAVAFAMPWHFAHRDCIPPASVGEDLSLVWKSASGLSIFTDHFLQAFTRSQVAMIDRAKPLKGAARS